MNRLLSVLIACAALGGCASTAQEGGSQFLAPTGVSDLYSRANMEFMLAITPNAGSACVGLQCDRRKEFDQRVARIGAQLAETAYRTHPELAERIPRFDFIVVDKAEAGTASAAGGYIVVLRPVSEIALSDEALSFVIAREMGHVVSKHHEHNTATTIAISVAATALAPVIGVARLLALLYSGSTSAVAASSLTSAASYASSRAVIESYWPQQRQEADDIALRLVAQIGYNSRRVAAGFAQECPQLPPTKWVGELKESLALLAPADDQPALPRVAQLGTPAQTAAAAERIATAVAECTATDATDIPAITITENPQSGGKSTGESDTSVALMGQSNPSEPATLLRAQSPH